jgi:hypothetical protein
MSSKIHKDVIATPELLKFYLFKENKGAVMTSYSMSISRSENTFKEITVALEPGNQYVMIREGNINAERHKDDIVVVYNGDFDGKLMLQRLDYLVYGLTGKWLNR